MCVTMFFPLRLFIYYFYDQQHNFLPLSFLPDVSSFEADVNEQERFNRMLIQHN